MVSLEFVSLLVLRTRIGFLTLDLLVPIIQHLDSSLRRPTRLKSGNLGVFWGHNT